jgi:hypothetical protein
MLKMLKRSKLRLIGILFPYNYFAGIFLKVGKGEFANTKKYQGHSVQKCMCQEVSI